MTTNSMMSSFSGQVRRAAGGHPRGALQVSVLVLGKQHKSSLYRATLRITVVFQIDGETLLQDAGSRPSTSARTSSTKMRGDQAADSWFHIKVESGTEIRSRALFSLSGVFRNKLNVRGEKELLGRGSATAWTATRISTARSLLPWQALKAGLDRSPHTPLLHQRGAPGLLQAGSEQKPSQIKSEKARFTSMRGARSNRSSAKTPWRACFSTMEPP